VSLNFRDEVLSEEYRKIRASQGTKTPDCLGLIRTHKGMGAEAMKKQEEFTSRYLERVAELMLNKFNGLHGTKIELVKHRNKENTRRTRTECYPGVLSF